MWEMCSKWRRMRQTTHFVPFCSISWPKLDRQPPLTCVAARKAQETDHSLFRGCSCNPQKICAMSGRGPGILSSQNSHCLNDWKSRNAEHLQRILALEPLRRKRNPQKTRKIKACLNFYRFHQKLVLKRAKNNAI